MDILGVAAVNGNACFVAQQLMHRVHIAAFSGNAALVKQMVIHNRSCMDAGLPMDTRIDKMVIPAKATPLIVGAIRGHNAVVRELLNLGANKEIQDDKSMTPVLWACKLNHVETLKVLVDAGAAVDGKGTWVTPLSTAAFYGASDCVEFLLTLSIDVNAAPGERGDTALHNAAMVCSPRCVEALLAKGADPTIRNKWGMTPLDLAEGAGCNFDHERAAKRDTIALLCK